MDVLLKSRYRSSYRLAISSEIITTVSDNYTTTPLLCAAGAVGLVFILCVFWSHPGPCRPALALDELLFVAFATGGGWG